jgi:hypothetical protein
MNLMNNNSIFNILSSLNPMTYFKDLESGRNFYTEDNFHKQLTKERQRTERYQKPFLLMLIDLKDLIKSKSDMSFMNKSDFNERTRKVENVLIGNTREVDLKGWYRFHGIIGVIFSEIDTLDRNFVKNKIHTKLCDAFGAELINNIVISFYGYPQGFINQIDINKRAE